MPSGNAIARRLNVLTDQWTAFATNPDARLLRWLVRDDEYRMVETFIQSEQDDEAGNIPDLFLRFTDPFVDVGTYGAALKDSLIAQYEAAREELEVDGGAPGNGGASSELGGFELSWKAPPTEGRHSLVAFVEACAALTEHHDDVMEKLAVILTPTTIANDGAWQRWLHAFAERLPDAVRATVIDSVDAPGLEVLAELLPEKVMTVPADLDMPGAIAELARAGGTSGPDGQFRVRFTHLAQSLGKGDLEAAKKDAHAAAAVAKENDWTHLVAAVHMALAGGYLSAGRHEEAISVYGDTERAGAELEEKGDQVGGKLRLQAGMGAGAALLAAGHDARAASAYAATATQAEKVGDHLMLLECRRMAAYCHERLGDTAQAWELGLGALDAGEAMGEEDRARSTLPFAGDGLLRLAAQSPDHERLVQERLAGLLGRPDWRAALTDRPDFA